MRHGYKGGVTMTWSTGTFSLMVPGLYAPERKQAGRRILAASAAVAVAAAASAHVTTSGFLANEIMTNDTPDSEGPDSLKRTTKVATGKESPNRRFSGRRPQEAQLEPVTILLVAMTPWARDQL